MINAARTRIERAVQKIGQPESSSNNQFEDKVPQPPANLSIDSWVSDVRQKRAALLERRNIRKQRKQDLAKRRTVAAQERMRIISQLARKDKDDDDFGMRDEDWDVYKAVRHENHLIHNVFCYFRYNCLSRSFHRSAKMETAIVTLKMTNCWNSKQF